MKTRVTLLLTLALALGWVVTNRTVSADEKDDFAALMKLHTPGPAHKVLQPFVGTWQAKVKMYSEPGKPSESEGTMTRKWILDGRFLEEKFEGNFGGMEFKGIGLTGYDNVKKKYTGLWIDSMSTSMMTSEGNYNEDTKTFSYAGEYYCVKCKANVKSRDVVRIVDDNTIEQKMYRTEPGSKETISMEITYTRKGK